MSPSEICVDDNCVVFWQVCSCTRQSLLMWKITCSLLKRSHLVPSWSSHGLLMSKYNVLQIIECWERNRFYQWFRLTDLLESIHDKHYIMNAVFMVSCEVISTMDYITKLYR